VEADFDPPVSDDDASCRTRFTAKTNSPPQSAHCRLIMRASRQGSCIANLCCFVQAITPPYVGAWAEYH
jgi:hypothetical protein